MFVVLYLLDCDYLFSMHSPLTACILLKFLVSTEALTIE